MKYTIKYKVIKHKSATINSAKNCKELWDELATKYQGYKKDHDNDEILAESLEIWQNGECVALY